MCVINIKIETEGDLYFAISSTILSMRQDSFTVEDILKELRENNIEDTSDSPNMRCRVVKILDNLKENGRIIEYPRRFKLTTGNLIRF